MSPASPIPTRPMSLLMPPSTRYTTCSLFEEGVKRCGLTKVIEGNTIDGVVRGKFQVRCRAVCCLRFALPRPCGALPPGVV